MARRNSHGTRHKECKPHEKSRLTRFFSGCYRPKYPMRHWLEYLPVWLLLRAIGALPRSWAHIVGMGLAALVYRMHPKLRRVGTRKLEIIFPQMPAGGSERILRAAFRTICGQLGEFFLLPRDTPENVKKL